MFSKKDHENTHWRPNFGAMFFCSITWKHKILSALYTGIRDKYAKFYWFTEQVSRLRKRRINAHLLNMSLVQQCFLVSLVCKVHLPVHKYLVRFIRVISAECINSFLFFAIQTCMGPSSIQTQFLNHPAGFELSRDLNHAFYLPRRIQLSYQQLPTHFWKLYDVW